MKKYMTKALAALLTLAMALGALPALAAGGDLTIFRQGQDGNTYSLRAMAYYDSTLYIFTYGNAYYTWTRESGTLTEYPFDDSFERNVGSGRTEMRCVIAGPDGLYAILIDYESVEDGPGGNTSFSEARLCKLAFAQDGAISFDEGVELDWDDMVESYDEYEYSREVRFPFITGNTLVFATYGNDGTNNQLFAYDIGTGDYETIELEAGDATPSIEGMCAYGEGRALVATFGYTSEDEQVVFYAVDLATGAATEALKVPSKNYNVPSNLLYDPAADALYYTLSGELIKVPALDAAKAGSVAAVQIDSWSDKAPVLTADGYFICSDYDTVIARSTDPSARATTRLTVYTNYNQSMDGAYYAFANPHPDVEVVVATSYEDITEAMMNQSDAVDIYTVDVAGDDYAALFDRGYLADLSGSETLTGLVSSMYPGIRDMVMKDGALYALPVEMYSECWTYNPKAAEKLGLTEEDIPKNWMQLLKFLQTAPERIGDAGVLVFDSYMTVGDAKSSVFYGLFNDYMMYLQKTEGVEMAFDTELLRGLVAELDKIDFTQFGLPESYEDYDDGPRMGKETGDEGQYVTLFYFYGDVSVNSYMYQSEYSHPMPLAVADGLEPMIRSHLTVSFVNPYSKNAELAIRYLEAAVGELPEYFLANACPDRNEPIPNAYYEENIGYYEDYIASLQAELEKADEDDKAEWQAQLDDYQKYYEDYKKTGAWDATAESIAAYRQYGPYLRVDENFGLNSDRSGGLYDYVQQYLDGAIDGATMLQNIDKKLKMMLQEGM